MKIRTRVILIMLVGIFGLILIDRLFDKKVVNVEPDTTIVEQTTRENTTTGTTTTTTKKTTKKVVKTTKKTTRAVSKVNTTIGTKQEYLNYAKEYGNLNDTQLQCLDYLWTRESNWNPNDVNKSSGACGIPQAYPCSKIKQQQGSNDWKAQIRWGLNYINYRYKNPCSAWNHFKNKHWY